MGVPCCASPGPREVHHIKLDEKGAPDALALRSGDEVELVQEEARASGKTPAPCAPRPRLAAPSPSPLQVTCGT